MARALYVAAAIAIVAAFGLLHVLGGREATLVLTGAQRPSAALGLAYVAAWLGAVAIAPSLLLGAALDVALAGLRSSRRGRKAIARL
jgi:L-asparaginase/Glu-tRNA(Gln) amidotransferase subunit D